MNKISEYKSFIHALASTREDRVFLNSDEEKALAVLVELIQNAEQELRIFAGSLCNSIGNNYDYIVAISEFIERGGKVKILLNQYEEDRAKNSNLFKRLAYYIAQGKGITIKETQAKAFRSKDPEKKEIHFTVADDRAYRVETDTEKRTAECNFNNPEIAKTIIVFFDSMFNHEAAKELDILSLIYG